MEPKTVLHLFSKVCTEDQLPKTWKHFIIIYCQTVEVEINCRPSHQILVSDGKKWFLINYILYIITAGRGLTMAYPCDFWARSLTLDTNNRKIRYWFVFYIMKFWFLVQSAIPSYDNLLVNGICLNVEKTLLWVETLDPTNHVSSSTKSITLGIVKFLHLMSVV